MTLPNAQQTPALSDELLDPEVYRALSNLDFSVYTAPRDTIFQFGMIGDVQFADADDAPNFSGSTVRRYRGALSILAQAVEYWNEAIPSPGLSFVVQLGDLIDGRNINEGNSESSLQRTVSLLRRINTPLVCSTIGNHELYNFTRAQLLDKLRIRTDQSSEQTTFAFHEYKFYNELLKSIASNADAKLQQQFELLNQTSLIPELSTKHFQSEQDIDEYFKRTYYSFRPTKGYRVVILDSYWLTVCGRDSAASTSWLEYVSSTTTPTSELEEYLFAGTFEDPESEISRYAEAVTVLNTYNPNVYLTPRRNWQEGLVGRVRRFVPFNGALGRRQIDWLDGELEAAHKLGEKVLVFSHVALEHHAASYSVVCWDADEALAVLRRRPGTVVSFISGHYHRGGYWLDESGIHHITVDGPIEAQPGTSCFATVSVTPDAIHVRGVGSVESRVLRFFDTSTQMGFEELSRERDVVNESTRQNRRMSTASEGQRSPREEEEPIWVGSKAGVDDLEGKQI